MHKILIISNKDEGFFIEALAEVVEGGGELFFATDVAAANAICKRENPQIGLVDEGVSKDQLELSGIFLIVLKQPLYPKPLLSLVRQAFGNAPTSTPKIPPM